MNAQQINMVGDGFGYTADVFNNQAPLVAHGQTMEAVNITGGFAINSEMEPMPLSIGMGGDIKTSNLPDPKHIRNVKFIFNDTIGGTINGVPIALNTMQNTIPGVPPIPSSGIFEVSVMEGWNDFNNPSFKISHSEPYDIRLLGVFYVVEV